jgi:trimeric autotransporter adhesin
VERGRWWTPPGVAPAPPPKPGERYVTFDLAQQATFDRQAFTGKLTLHNGSKDRDLEKILINIKVADGYGNVLAPDHRVTGDLFFAEPVLGGALTGVDGLGTLPAGSNGSSQWLIIPTAEAGGKTYQLQAHVMWEWSGIPDQLSSEPATINVDPQPKVQLDYFIQPRFDAGEPFYLGVMASNVGPGTARNLRIETQQPRIDWGATGVPNASARITEAFVVEGGEQRRLSSLTLDLGDLGPEQTALGWWTLEAYPGGEVTIFAAEVSHDEALGGQATSLLEHCHP